MYSRFFSSIHETSDYIQYIDIWNVLNCLWRLLATICITTLDLIRFQPNKMFFAMKKITLFSCVWNKRKKMRSVLLLVIILLCLNILLATFNATDGSISQDDEHLEINHLKKTAFYSIAGIYSALRNARNSHDFERNLVLEKHDEILRKIPVTHSKIQYFWDDRIFHQLHINLSDSKQQTNLFRNERLTYAAYEFEKRQKNILVYNGLDNWAIKQGSLVFKDMNCLHKNCHITSDRSTFQDVDVILFQSQLPEISKTRPNQLWLLYLLESPYNTPSFKNSQNLVNWTASYRLDSTIATPYEKYIPFNFSVLTRPATKNYAEGKTRQVAWFVSNCVTPNKRRQYVNELAQHITIDIYGACGAYRCQRSKSEDCFNMLNSRYKFYLAFENSNCKNYITEKFFINGLQ